uniref:Uncharacterized protein n=1 Tax=Amphimedon queenslandica TaxID=400682 RepID=A0A1X7UPH1_AMPQE
CESFNSLIRSANVFCNRLTPSYDIPMLFSVLVSLSHISSGAFINGNQKTNGAVSVLTFYVLHCFWIKVWSASISMRTLK